MLSSIPSLDFFRLGRSLRVFRIIRVIRVVKVGKGLYSYIMENKRENIALSAILLTVLLIFIGSAAILVCESGHSNALIKTAQDAIWWTIVTITTVGYGDLYPVTLEGRGVAIFLMFSGVGLFSVFTGLLASWFLKESK